MVLAGLRNINAKHIALASQALAVVIALLPHLKMIYQALSLVESDRLDIGKSFDNLETVCLFWLLI